jgi:hypothetical protein
MLPHLCTQIFLEYTIYLLHIFIYCTEMCIREIQVSVKHMPMLVSPNIPRVHSHTHGANF